MPEKTASAPKLNFNLFAYGVFLDKEITFPTPRILYLDNRSPAGTLLIVRRSFIEINNMFAKGNRAYGAKDDD